jgi:hypothetical protein
MLIFGPSTKNLPYLVPKIDRRACHGPDSASWLGRKFDKWSLAAVTAGAKLFIMSYNSMMAFRTISGFLSCLVGLLGASAMGQTGGNTAPTSVGHAPSNPVLVELFTSEGCSSCPPADEFVRKLDQVQPVADAQLIVLSEHVDYWDHEGWKDPYSSTALTDRQAAYERVLGLSTSYTPQLIIDGAGEIHLTDPQQIERVFQQAAAMPKIPVRLDSLSIDPAPSGQLRAHVLVDAGATKFNGDVYLAVALDHADSQVLRGENGGRHLVHTAVVEQLVKIGKLEKGQKFAQDVQIKLKPGIDPLNLRVIAFVQAPGPGKLLGAALWKSEH